MVKIALFAVVLVGCAAPLPITRADCAEAQYAASRASESALLLAPRLGRPAIVTAAQSGVTVDVELALRGGAPLPRLALCAATCRPVIVEPLTRRPVAGDITIVVARAHTDEVLAPGGYDLVVDGRTDERAPKAVWVRASDPERAARGLRVAHLSDLHIGKHRDSAARLAELVAELNRMAPDLVVVTGDVADNGERGARLAEAAALLARLEAPVVVVPGNHDHGFSPLAIAGASLASGWATFARTFHPSLLFEIRVDGWRFVAFDSGASVFSPFIWTRGLDDDAIVALRERIEAARRSGDRGVVLLSHAPSRARLTGDGAPSVAGPFGRMLFGAHALEQLIVEEATDEFRVFHLAGHTHWADVFEEDARGRFVRWDRQALFDGAHPITGPAALITMQSSTHTTFHLLARGRGRGFGWLELPLSLVERPRFALHRL
jgi:Icc-related predicted phosphoesterase